MEAGLENTGKLIVVTAPSGAGKTTIVRHLLKQINKLDFSISATSRSPRYYEKEGQDYYFLSPEEFRKKIDDGAFLEWEEVYENQFYGTLKSELTRLWASGKHIVFDIDVKGAVNIQNLYRDRTLTMFIKPPSEEVLFERLNNRRTESAASLRKRINRAKDELKYESKFDTFVVNDKLEVALKEAEEKVRNFLKLP